MNNSENNEKFLRIFSFVLNALFYAVIFYIIMDGK
jgi:hypothetical protein